MQRLMELTIAGGAGLTQGEARWMDDRVINFWSPEQLEPETDYRVRVDLAGMGDSVDVTARVKRCVAVRSRRGGHGFLHGAVWQPVDPEDLPRLLAALTQTNPAWARRVGRAGPDLPSVSSQPAISSVLVEHTHTRAETSRALRDVVRRQRDREEYRGRGIQGLPVQVSVLGSTSPRVIARFARSSVPGRYLKLEPGGALSCRLPCQQDLHPGESARVTLGLPGRRVVRGRGIVRGAGRTWVDIVLEVSEPDRAYLIELIEAAERGAGEAAPAQPSAEGLPTAEVSLSGPPSLFVGYESWSAVEDSLGYDGRGLRFRLLDPAGGWRWRDLTVLFSLPGGLFIQFPARSVRGRGEVLVASSRLPSGQALIRIIERARRGPEEIRPLQWR